MRYRADRWLRDRFPSLTRRQTEEALEAGLARHFTGRKAHKGDKVESLETRALEEHIAQLRSGTPGLDVSVVREGAEWIAVDKPPGLDAHPLSLFDDKTLTHWAFAKWPDLRIEFPGIQPTLVPHRLDRDTSGLQIVALTPAAFGQWRARFHHGQVTKRYLAWVWGEPKQASWIARWPVAHDLRDDRKMVVVSSKARYRPPVLEAHTEFRIAEKGQGMTLLEATCRTGVTHQVRVHAAESGLPLVGDKLYDAEFEARGLTTPGHWLRAVALEWEAEKLEIPVGRFRQGPITSG
jgi:23S rRNA pseudouridine1911/1915/1917 synthase